MVHRTVALTVAALALSGLIIDGGQAQAALPNGYLITGAPTALAPALQQAGQEESTAGEADDALVPQSRLAWHVPDPQASREEALKKLEEAVRDGERAAAAYGTRVIDRVDVIHRPEQLDLSLEDALRRALDNSYAIETAAYSPAIETARVVEAEAVFDALFYTNVIKNIQDKPVGSDLASSYVNYFDLRSGVRKLLPTGMQVGASYGVKRTYTSIVFQQINPEYFSDITLEMRQPLLRGFGIDYNRSLIVIAKNNRLISDYAFRRQVRDTLRQVEEAYWRLVQARRDVVVTARLLAGFEAIYEYLEARRDFDVIPVQLAATKANLESARWDFVRRCANVFDAEDQLTASMNAPDINLADAVEIIPLDFPSLSRIVVDPLAEVQVGLDHRPEIKEDELNVANAKIAVGRAKNEELPKLDLTFRYMIDGLAGNADKAFDEVSRNKYSEYYVGVDLEVPIGNRGPRAATKRAKLQHDQAVSRLKLRFEEVILDVNMAVRELSTTYEQIASSFEAAEAREREVESIVARAERMDINTLTNELNARQSLAAARRAMLAAVVDYNIAIIDLERAKGTLLRHYNVAVAPNEGE